MKFMRFILDFSLQRRNAVVLFYICLSGVFVLSVIPCAPPGLEKSWDKANHAVAFFVLAYLSFAAFRDIIIKMAVFLVMFGIIIEAVQFFIPWREFSCFDIMADCIGILLGGGLFFLALALRKRIN